MKKIFLLTVMPFVFFSALTAQITQQQADSIILERMRQETRQCIINTKEGLQTENIIITTSTEEVLELDYPCWIYYIRYIEQNNNRYLIVNESNGNLLEINTNNDTEPDDLAGWRIITENNYPIEIPFTEYSLAETSCQLTNFEPNKVIIINSDEKLQDYIVCADDDYSRIDFSTHSLLLVRGGATSGIRYIDINLLKETAHEYTFNVSIHTYMTTEAPPWLISIITPKIDSETTITLNVQQIND